MCGHNVLQWSGYSPNVYTCLMHSVPVKGPDYDKAVLESK